MLCDSLVHRAGSEAIAILTENDWEPLVEMARREGVGPLLFRAGTSAGWIAQAPPSARLTLGALFLRSESYNRTLFEELDERILPALSPGIDPVVLLKGAALARTLYPEAGLRPMRDIDLLVPKQHMTEAERRLRDIGYIRSIPPMGAGSEFSHDVHLVCQRSRTHVEIHWTLVGSEASRLSPAMEWFFARTESFPVKSRGGTEYSIHTLNPTAHLLYLCAHLMLQHGESSAPLIWFHDIDLLVRVWETRIDWAELSRQADACWWTPALRCALEGAVLRFGTPVPEGYLDALDGSRHPLSAWRVRTLKNGDATNKCQAVYRELKTLRGTDRIRRLLQIAFPAPAYMRWRYRPRPSWSWPLCYPRRWGIVLWDLLKDLGCRLGGASPLRS